MISPPAQKEKENEVEKTTPKEDEVLVKVYVASVNFLVNRRGDTLPGKTNTERGTNAN